MAVSDEMLDEELDPGRVVEQDAARAGAVDAAVEEHAGRSAARDETVEPLPLHADRRDEQPVDAVREQRAQGRDLAVGCLARVHQQHPVAGLLEHALGALERRRVERARDVGDDEADRRGRARPERPRQMRGLEMEGVRRLEHGRPGLGRELAAPVQGARGRRRRYPRVLGDIRERDLARRPQTIAQAIATLT